MRYFVGKWLINDQRTSQTCKLLCQIEKRIRPKQRVENSAVLDVNGFDPLPALGSNRRIEPEVEFLDGSAVCKTS